jgi:hypothetical protein
MFVTAEVRWFYQDECPANLHRWFGETSPAPGGGKLRLDKYLLQTNQSEMSAKMRGERSGLEIKGLVAVCRSDAVPFAPYVELWCKWSLQPAALEITKTVIVQKTRWLRTYDATRADIVEIPLQKDEMPLNGQPLPRQGCNVEFTKVQVAQDPRQWWTLGLEAFGDLESSLRNLQMTTQYLIAQSFPVLSCGEFLNYPSWLARIKS